MTSFQKAVNMHQPKQMTITMLVIILTPKTDKKSKNRMKKSSTLNSGPRKPASRTSDM